MNIMHCYTNLPVTSMKEAADRLTGCRYSMIQLSCPVSVMIRTATCGTVHRNVSKHKVSFTIRFIYPYKDKTTPNNGVVSLDRTSYLSC